MKKKKGSSRKLLPFLNSSAFKGGVMMNKKDIKIGIILLIFSVINYNIIIPYYVKGHTLSGLSPTFFPKLATIFLGIFSLALILSRWDSIRNKKEKEDNKGKKKEVGIVSYISYRVLITITIMSIYLILFKQLGFLWATPPILVLLMFLFGMPNFKHILFFCITTTVILLLLFEKGLKIPLN